MSLITIATLLDLTIGALFFASPSAADSKSPDGGTYFELQDERWGLLSKNGKLILLPAFVRPTSRVSDGKILFQSLKNGDVGFLNTAGKQTELNGWLLTEDESCRFVDGVAPMRLKSSPLEYYYVKPDGTPAIRRCFYGAKPFSEGLAAVVVDKPPECIPGFAYSSSFSNRRLWGYINRAGKIVIAPKFYEAGEFHAGRAVVSLSEDGRDTAIIDCTGKIISSYPRGTSIQQYSADGLAAFYMRVPSEKPFPPYGLIDKDGKPIHPVICFKNYSEGLGLLNNSKYSFDFADSKGTVRLKIPKTISIEYGYIEPFISNGMISFPTRTIRIKGWKHKGTQAYIDQPLYGFTDIYGKRIPPLSKGREITYFFPFSEGYALVQTTIPIYRTDSDKSSRPATSSSPTRMETGYTKKLPFT